ncbi:MAG TPA: phosphoglucosamine mutase [Candidatus Limnocylindria bacterium]|jgi:phosphoglucosamine mutase|nr:phosphoglucosamine mutase [Candidatus Limnocylindria bacterium]
MTRLFGTDGIRGKANVELLPLIAFALGRAAAHRLLQPGESLLVGQDTRRSGDMFVAAIVAGATSIGADVHRLGVCPTPALAHATAGGPYRAGVMVSASHNPADDNGLKVLDAEGLKLDDALEDELETLIVRADGIVGPANAGLGRVADVDALLEQYIEHRSELARRTRSELSVMLDCAHGSGGVAAPQILAASGARLEVRFNEPDGTNINLDCGATAPATLAALVASSDAQLGFALDGDGDRCVAIDESGGVVDGDQLIGVIALDRLRRGALPNGICVVSVLSNGGLQAAIEAAGGRVARTQVGDKYILEGMIVAGAGLGGEKSGHIIIREHAMSGDGIVTAIEVLDILARADRPLSELAAEVELYPQQQRTVAARHKEQWSADPTFADAVAQARSQLDGTGRVIVRPSGTEAALRIMVEGESEAQVAALADGLASLAAERLN